MKAVGKLVKLGVTQAKTGDQLPKIAGGKKARLGILQAKAGDRQRATKTNGEKVGRVSFMMFHTVISGKTRNEEELIGANLAGMLHSSLKNMLFRYAYGIKRSSDRRSEQACEPTIM